MSEEIRRARRLLGDAKDPNMKLLLLFVLLLALGACQSPSRFLAPQNGAILPTNLMTPPTPP
jgi:hypothetical protein